MKKIIIIALIAMLVSTMLCGNVMAEAPNSGDGISDGSGWDDIPPQEGDPNSDAESPGPAPNSGDGIPDGSGF